MVQKKRILITGATGFIGKHLCEGLAQQGMICLPLTRSSSTRPPPVWSADLGSLTAVDLLDEGALRAVFDRLRPHSVIHLASNLRRDTDKQALSQDDDVQLGKALVRASTDYSARIKRPLRFVYTGSCEEYGNVLAPYDEKGPANPQTSYGRQKLAVTQLLDDPSLRPLLDPVILRLSVVYGPGQQPRMLIPSLIQAMKKNRPIEMTDGKQLRDFLFVLDLVDAIVCALKADTSRDDAWRETRVINVANGASVPVRNMAIALAAEFGPDAHKLMEFGALPQRESPQSDYRVLTERAAQLLGWRSRTSLRLGLSKTLQIDT